MPTTVTEPHRLRTKARRLTRSLLKAGEGLESVAAFEEGDFLIRISGPLMPAWAKEFESLGVVLRERTDEGYLARLYAEDQVVELLELPYLLSVSPVREAPKSRAPQTGLLYVLQLREGTDLEAFEKAASKSGARVIARYGTALRVAMPRPAFEAVSAMPEVVAVRPYLAPRLHNDCARSIVSSASIVVGTTTLDGSGQMVAVADTGLDRKHPDIPASRVAQVVALGRPGDSSDPHGHGTHVAGTILGDGKASARRGCWTPMKNST